MVFPVINNHSTQRFNRLHGFPLLSGSIDDDAEPDGERRQENKEGSEAEGEVAAKRFCRDIHLIMFLSGRQSQCGNAVISY